jgi:hypothetical protein
VFDVFKNFYVIIEKETSKKPKCVQANSDGEYKGLFSEVIKGT